MKPHELLILSGKGGTGKTTVTGSFAHLAKNPVIVDCDVDASDLHLLLNPSILEKHPFISGQKAVVETTRCSGCGICEELCQFHAVSMGERAEINPMNCEGCSVCAHFCPEDAIELTENHCGEWYISDTAYSKMVHAHLFAGEENSGKLVSFIKQRALETAEETGAELLLIDGAPGIGCPVIASISGCDTILAVTEPSLSGWHDLERILDLAEHFQIICHVCINKFDLNPDLTQTITARCEKRNAAVIGTIPFDPQVVSCQIEGRPVVSAPDSPAALAVTAIWKTLTKKMENRDSPAPPPMFP